MIDLPVAIASAPRVDAWVRLLGAMLMVVRAVVGSAAEPAVQPPNVVILYADDMGYGDLGANNPDSKIPTPHLDRLASAGTRFTDAHSSSGVCTPSRYALLHGRYHWRKFHGIVQSFDQPILDAERTTLAELLRGRGHATAAFGKWHLGWDWEAIRRTGAKPRIEGKNKIYAAADFDWRRKIPGGPLAHGFDRYFGDDVPNFPPYAWFEDDRIPVAPTLQLMTTGEPPEGNWECRPGPMVHGWDFHAVMPTLTDRAVAWIEQQTPDRPFFLYFPFTSPHAPILPTAAFTGRSAAGPYGDFVAQTDDTVGRVLDALEREGFAENTLVIFTSDNGPERYAYERTRAFGHRSMGPLRGLKRDLWEGGHRVPMIVRWPGHVPAGRVADGLVSQVDLYATIAAAVGAAIPAGSAEDSLNQLAWFEGKAPSARRELVHNTHADGYALRQDDWILIDAPSGGISEIPPWYLAAEGIPTPTHPGELYDLRTDPGERHNRFDSDPDRVAAMQRRLDALLGR